MVVKVEFLCKRNNKKNKKRVAPDRSCPASPSAILKPPKRKRIRNFDPWFR
jgi:hypothetical protein